MGKDTINVTVLTTVPLTDNGEELLWYWKGKKVRLAHRVMNHRYIQSIMEGNPHCFRIHTVRIPDMDDTDIEDYLWDRYDKLTHVVPANSQIIPPMIDSDLIPKTGCKFYREELEEDEPPF